jgi:pimeloyl-ACP methyl ester carboxylesterase
MVFVSPNIYFKKLTSYRSISGIPHTHLLTCDYRGFGLSTLKNAPHIPTEPGLITDAISLVSYLLNTLHHPASRTVLCGQSLGTAVTAASALYFTDPSSAQLPSTITAPTTAQKHPQSFAGIVLVSPFTDIPTLLQTYRIGGFIPILSALKGYPRLVTFFSTHIADTWPTLPRLQALLSSSSSSSSTTATPIHITILHARNDQDIDFRLSETLYAALEKSFLGKENVVSGQERRSIHGGERVKRGAFAYRFVEDADVGLEGGRSVELEVVRYGGHNELVGWSQVGLAVRRMGVER